MNTVFSMNHMLFAKRYKVVSILLLCCAISSCISDPKVCADTRPNFITSTGCMFGGGYDAALQGQSEDLIRLQNEKQLTKLELREIDARAEKLAGDVMSYHRELDRQNRELDKLRARIAKLSPELEQQSITRDTMFQEIEALQLLVSDARSSGDADEEEIRVLTEEVEQRRKVLESLAEAVPIE